MFSRLFAVEHPALIHEMRQALQHDEAWLQALRHLAERLQIATPEGALRWQLNHYQSPVRPGRIVEGGHGRGLWRHLEEIEVHCMGLDRNGSIWFGTNSGPVLYDGQLFEPVAAPEIPSSAITQRFFLDRKGDLWLVFRGSRIVRYDGRQFHAIDWPAAS
jgi:hypothetical protein